MGEWTNEAFASHVFHQDARLSLLIMKATPSHVLKISGFMVPGIRFSLCMYFLLHMKAIKW